MLDQIFEVFAGLTLLRALFTWRSQIRLWRYVRNYRAPSLDDALGAAAILLPVKGVDPDFRATFQSLLRQDFPCPYDLILSLESPDDPALGLIAEEIERSGKEGTRKARSVRMVIAGLCYDRGQKVHNLNVAVKELDGDIALMAFIDSDARPSPRWLLELSLPLGDQRVGATTGFRWYLPIQGGWASSLATLWNSMTVGLLAREGRKFAWGGSMAIRRELFFHLDVPERYWKGSVSDDGGLTAAIKDAGLRITFVPHCLLPSLHDFTAKGLWEFVTRQFIITRLYIPGLYPFALAASSFDVLGFHAALAYAAVASLLGHPPLLMWGFLILGYGFCIATGILRYRGSLEHFKGQEPLLRKTRSMLIFGAPLAWLFNFCALLAAARRRVIIWRKIRYTLLGQNRIEIEHPSTPS